MSTASIRQCLILLALDSMEPFLKEAGFTRHLADARAAVRRHFPAERRINALDDRAVARMAMAVSSDLAARHGATAGSAFLTWVGGFFVGTHADMPDWSGWEIALSRMLPAAIASAMGMSEAGAAALVGRHRQAIDTADIDALRARTVDEALSPWDVEVYAGNDLDDLDEMADPYQTMRWAVRMHRFRRFWVETMEALTPAAREGLLAAAQAKLDELGVWMPGPLGWPSTEVAAPCC